LRHYDKVGFIGRINDTFGQRHALVKIADAWTQRALEVERQQKKSGDRVNE
jgi:hypothetical protein